jgi:hypothetical protein
MRRQVTTSPSLFDQPYKLDEAIAAGVEGMAAAEGNADPDWLKRAYDWVKGRPPGWKLIAEDIVLELAEQGCKTHNNKAIGPVMKRLAKEGVIVLTGELRRAQTSHGAYRPVWRVR